MMEYRTLGSSGLKVSSICLGTMTVGDQTKAAAAARIHRLAAPGHLSAHGSTDPKFPVAGRGACA